MNEIVRVIVLHLMEEDWYEIMSLPSSELEALNSFVDALNTKLFNSDDPALQWKVIIIKDEPTFTTAMEVAKYFHKLDGTGSEMVDNIYKEMIRLHFDKEYNESTLQEE